jgi:hypothetical protein
LFSIKDDDDNDLRLRILSTKWSSASATFPKARDEGDEEEEDVEEGGG